jgi:hypothetical protein
MSANADFNGRIAAILLRVIDVGPERTAKLPWLRSACWTVTRHIYRVASSIVFLLKLLQLTLEASTPCLPRVFLRILVSHIAMIGLIIARSGSDIVPIFSTDCHLRKWMRFR